jgi:tetratricopeptide (TPR) repeat protein
VAANSSVAGFAAARTAFAQGNLLATERLCLQLAADFPDAADPWSLLTETALKRGRPDAAIVCADKAVARAGGDPVAHLMRAKSLTVLGRLRDAHEAAGVGARLAAGNVAALDGLGAILSMLGDHERALGLLRTALEIDPGNPQVLYNLAASERVTGRLEEAEAHCNQAIARDPHHYLAYFLRADLREQGTRRNHIAEMEALLQRGVRHPQGEVLLCFALGKECDDIGEYARAFRHFAAGAALHRKSMRYLVHDDIGAVDRIIQTHGRDVLNTASKGHDGDDPIFIVGLPRSGTTLVERIVGAHSLVRSAGELGAFPRALKQGSDPAAWGLAYIQAARQYRGIEAGRFIDKFPSNYLHCGAIHMALPRARIVALRREPMDTCLALFKAHFAGAYPFSYRLEDLADYYAAFDRLMTHWRSVLPPEVFLEVAYEDIVADLEGQSRRLLAFLGLPWEDEVLKFHESRSPAATASAVQVRRPLYASSVGKWRRYADELAPLALRLAVHLEPGSSAGVQ